VGAFPFVVIDPPKLETQQDDRRLALELIREIRDAGKLRCSAKPKEQTGRQCDALLLAFAKLHKEGATKQARAGFAVVLCDLLGRALHLTLVPEIFAEREQHSEFMRWKGD
jgi:hypothetical protein